MTSYIINYLLETFQLHYIEDLLRLIGENSSSYMNKVKSFFLVQKDTSEKSLDISKIRDKKVFCYVPKAN